VLFRPPQILAVCTDVDPAGRTRRLRQPAAAIQKSIAVRATPEAGASATQAVTAMRIAIQDRHLSFNHVASEQKQ
jgi:hypothetical protein